jgi:hypothetical protein
MQGRMWRESVRSEGRRKVLSYVASTTRRHCGRCALETAGTRARVNSIVIPWVKVEGGTKCAVIVKAGLGTEE